MTKQVKTCLDKLRREEPKSRNHSIGDGEAKQKGTEKGQNVRLEHIRKDMLIFNKFIIYLYSMDLNKKINI